MAAVTTTATDQTRLDAQAYFRLADTGELAPDDRVELLDGVIVSMAPQDPPHASGVTLAMQVLERLLETRALVRVQLPLLVGSHSVPDPDIAVVPGSARDYFTSHPASALLIVEVADSSLAQDRLTKSRLYAAAGIPEYWILNVRDRCLEVHREPQPEKGVYGEQTVLQPGALVRLAAFPDVAVTVSELLPEAL